MRCIRKSVDIASDPVQGCLPVRRPAYQGIIRGQEVEWALAFVVGLASLKESCGGVGQPSSPGLAVHVDLLVHARDDELEEDVLGDSPCRVLVPRG